MSVAALLLLVTAPALVDDYLERGRAALQAGEYEAAVEVFEDAVEAQPGNADYHFWHGQALVATIDEASVFRKLGIARDMRKAWERAVELDSGHLDAREALMQYYLRAPGIAGGSRDDALAQVAAIAARDAVRGHTAMAAVHLADEDFAQANAEYAQALALAPDDLDLRMRHAFICQQIEDWACAAAEFERVVAREPAQMMAWYQLGRTALRSGEHVERGVDALKRYLQHDPSGGEPSLAWAHTRLGQLYLLQDQVDAARGQFERALALDPEHPEAATELKKINVGAAPSRRDDR